MKRELKNTCFLCLLLICTGWKGAYAQEAKEERKPQQEKELYLPEKVWRIPDLNAYDDPDSEYSHVRKVESANIALFWSKEYGDDPTKNDDVAKRFDPLEALEECERFYQYYVDTLQAVRQGDSLTERYKLLIYVIGGDEGTAFGGGAEEKVGVIWTPAVRIHQKPYGALAHEMAHCFQYLAKCDGAWAYSSPVEGGPQASIFEMTAQYMLWQVYPDWITFENYHLKGFMDKTHFAFLHETNMYHAPFVLEYWSEKYGKDFVWRLWLESKEGEDPVRTYKRLLNMDQPDFNDELFDAYRRFVTWDMGRISPYARSYTNQHHTQLDSVGRDHYRIADSHAPQNYGYNAIKLMPRAGKKVKVRFGGRAEKAVEQENAGWRYGFVAVQKTGERVYGEVYSKSERTVSFKVPNDTEYLWFVVSGAPKDHRVHIADWKDDNDEQWPYELIFTGTSPL